MIAALSFNVLCSAFAQTPAHSYIWHMCYCSCISTSYSLDASIAHTHTCINPSLSLLSRPLSLQLDDFLVNAESMRAQIAMLEKKQKKFDGQFSEQQGMAERNSQERDQAEARARQAETKALSLTRELEGYQDKLEELERFRKQLAVSGGGREI